MNQTAKVTVDNCELTFSDEDVVNVEDCDWGATGNYSRPWLLHDHGFPVAIVFANNLQDAIDIAVDENKMDRYLIDSADYADYGVETDEPTCTFLGNASEPFDIESLGYVELQNPPLSFAAMFNAANDEIQKPVGHHFA